jgi:hypothetical protein
MFYKNLLKELINGFRTVDITQQDLIDLGFTEVLEGRWLWLANKEVRTDGQVYVTWSNDGTCFIEGDSPFGSVRAGNVYLGTSANLYDLLAIVELLKL